MVGISCAKVLARRTMVKGSLAALSSIAAAKTADAQPDARLLAIAQRVIRAEEDEALACRAYDRGDPEDAERLDAVARAFAGWSDQVRQMAAVPAYGAVGLAVKAAVILQGFREGSTEATEALASSLRDDIERIAPSVVRLTA
jgi:hypothetical protein